MLNNIWLALIAIGIFVGGLLGRFSSDEAGGQTGVVQSMFDIVEVAVVGIAIPLSAVMMMWLGVMRLAEKSGMIQLISKALRPIMTRLFPDVPDDHPAMGAMIMNMAANMLGLGNAATPLGLKAMQQLDALNPHKGVATNAMCTFLAINTSSVTLIPATTIGILSSAGVTNPYQIIAPAILATACSTIVAIIAVKSFQGMPFFQVTQADIDQAAREAEAKEDPDEKPKLKPINGARRIILISLGVFFLFCFYLELFPDARTSLHQSLGISELVAQINAPGNSIAEAESDGALAVPFVLQGMFALSLLTIPFIFLFFTSYAALRGVRVYEEFVEGAKEGWTVAVRIMPYLVAMLLALAIFRSSGALHILQMMLRPLLDLVRFPVEVLPMALMRPLSGSGSQGILVDIVATPGIAESIKYTAATMFGSTETTFYVLAVYFGSVAIRKTRHALAAGLCADATGVIAAVIICKLMFG